MTLVERLREQASGDHARGCEGRTYSCDCGYDLSTEGLLEMAADEIADLKKANQLLHGFLNNRDTEIGRLRRALKDICDASNDPYETARAALVSPAEGKPGFFANLTPEQQKAALDYDGPENHGDPAFLLPPAMRECELHESPYGWDCTKCGAHWGDSADFTCKHPSEDRA